MIIDFDFSKDARRSSILSQLRALYDAPAWDQLCSDATSKYSLTAPDHYATPHEIYDALEGLNLPKNVLFDLYSIYDIIARAESEVHGVSIDKIHFHEVGKSASINNTILICLAFENLRPFVARSGKVQVGSGSIQCSHGILDIPAPATRKILERGIPIAKTRLEGELCTPTSAAMIGYYCFSSAFTVREY